MSDKVFEYFLTKFPHTDPGPPCTEQHLESYRGILPDALLSYWQECGFSGFGDGIVWLTDPIEWRDTTNALTKGLIHPDLGVNATYIPFARTAFGRTHFWTPGFGKSLTIDPSSGIANLNRQALTNDNEQMMKSFFGSGKKSKYDFTASGERDDPGFFDSVLERCGRLSFDEVYGFLPALTLGGVPKSENIVKFDIHTHLLFLRNVTGNWDTGYLKI